MGQAGFGVRRRIQTLSPISQALVRARENHITVCLVKLASESGVKIIALSNSKKVNPKSTISKSSEMARAIPQAIVLSHAWATLMPERARALAAWDESKMLTGMHA